MKYERSIPLILVSWGLVGGCVDTSPVDYVPESLNLDAGSSDGGGDGSAGLACRMCVTDEGAPCRGSYDTCIGAGKCEEVMTCLFDTNCMTFAVFADRYTCGLPCLTKYQVLSGTDPAIAVLTQINLCTLDHCKTECSGR